MGDLNQSHGWPAREHEVTRDHRMSLFLSNEALEVQCVNKVHTQQVELPQDCGTCAFRLYIVVYLGRP